jgi:hypothetical protein
MKKSTKVFLLGLFVVALLVFLANTHIRDGFQDMKKMKGEPCTAPEECQANMCAENKCA